MDQERRCSIVQYLPPLMTMTLLLVLLVRGHHRWHRPLYPFARLCLSPLPQYLIAISKTYPKPTNALLSQYRTGHPSSLSSPPVDWPPMRGFASSIRGPPLLTPTPVPISLLVAIELLEDEMQEQIDIELHLATEHLQVLPVLELILQNESD